VARVIGLAPGQEFEFTDKAPYDTIEAVTVDEALRRAYASRSDYQAAMTDVRAAEFARLARNPGEAYRTLETLLKKYDLEHVLI
jgi:outer membrane protein TolC